MNVVSTLAELAQADIRLWLEDGQLRFSAPDGAMTPERIAKLRQQKTEIVAFLGQSSSQQSEAISAIDKSQPLALSAAQQRLWFLNRLEPDNSAYNIHAALDIHGPLNKAKLKAACLAIIQRHDILHSHYRSKNNHNENSNAKGETVAIIDDINNDYIDTVYQQKTVSENDIDAQLEQQLNQVFDLANGPILSLRLFNISEDHHVLSFTIHHIASDGWSMGIFVSEIIAFYQADAETLAEISQRPALQYADYAAFQQQQSQQEKLNASLDYWKQQLSHVPAVQLPLDNQRSNRQSHDGASVEFTISAQQHEALQALCQAQGATLFMGLMALYSGLLFRTGNNNGNNDFAIGSPIAGRSHSQVEQMMGCFVNVLALRFEIDNTLSFNDLIQLSKNVISDAFLHQDLPFEQVVNALDIERDISINPVFQTLLSLQNSPLPVSNIDGLSISPIEPAEQAAQFDLSVNIYPNDDALNVKLIYKKALFNQETIERLSRQMQQLLNQVLLQPDHHIAKMSLLSTAEVQQLQAQLQQWNDTAVDIDLSNNIQAMIEAQVLATPKAIATEDSNFQLSYQQLNEQANQLAHYLIEKGIGEGDKVALHLAADNYFIIALLAVIKTGGAYIPIDMNYPSERCQFIVQQSQSKIVISLEDIYPNALALNQTFLDSQLSNFSKANPPLRQNPESLFYCIYTSGSTGMPKGVEVLERGTTNLIQWFREHYAFTSEDRFLISTSTAFDLTQKSFFGPLCSGGRLVFPVAEVFNPQAVYQLLIDKKITLINSAPTVLSSILSHHPSHAPKLSDFRYALLGGEPISETLVSRIRRSSNARISNMYGPTECTDISCSYEVTSDDKSCAIIGKPLNNISIDILDANQQPCAIGEIGELHISGINLAKGYIDDPEKTAKSFIYVNGKRLYNTFDLARYNSDGNIEYCGRNDHQVKIRGLRIELGEIEQQLLSIDGIDDAIVIVQQEKLVAFYLGENTQLDNQELRQALITKLPQYMLPASFIGLDDWPLTPSGKINRLALPQAEFQQRSSEYVAPESDTEKQLVGIWQRALNVEKIGIRDNFFDLGGHSLIAAEVFSLAQEQFHVDIPLREIFEQPNIQYIASVIDQATIEANVFNNNSHDEPDDDEELESFTL